MPRRILTDFMWEQLQGALQKHGCHQWKNDREIMEAILWKLRTGVPWRDVPTEFCPWKRRPIAERSLRYVRSSLVIDQSSSNNFFSR